MKYSDLFIYSGHLEIMDNDTAEYDKDDNFCEFDDSDDEDSNVTIQDMADTYFPGYIAHAAIKKIECVSCTNFMCKPPNNECENKNELLIKERTYVSFTPNGGLIVPQENFIVIIRKLIYLFEQNFDDLCYKTNLVYNFYNLLRDKIDFLCTDENHKKLVINSTIRVLIRAKLKIINAKAKQSKRRLKKFDIINYI